MLVKLYWTLWILTAAAALITFAAGGFTMMSWVVFGFLAFGLTFMGMISVLPVWASHVESAEPAAVQVPVATASPEPANAFAVLKSA